MPTARSIQTSLSSGEFDPLLWSREDVTFFYNSARLIENCIALPQGGAKRREGWSFRALQRGPLTVRDITGATITATNGGTPANIADGDDATKLTTTTGMGTTAVYEVARVQLAASSRVSAVVLRDLRTVGLLVSLNGIQFGLQSSTNGTAWTTRGEIKAGNSAADRAFSSAPDTDLATADYWRLVVFNPNALNLGAATVELSGMELIREDGYSNGGTLGDFSIHRLTATIQDEYIIYVVAGFADIFSATDGSWVASVPLPHTDGQVSSIKNSPKLDTLIFYHEDVHPWVVQRLGDDENWRSARDNFDSVTRFPFDDPFVSGGENEIQYLTFGSMNAGDILRLELNGQSSDEVTWTATAATNAAALATAAQSLDDITSVTGAVANGTGADAALTLEFTGVDGKRSWPILIVDIVTGSGTVELSRQQYGVPDKDDLWSETRGYPSCGTFYQGRRYMAGFKARPDLIVASRAGQLFDFKEDADPVAGSPIVVAPDVDDQITIHNLYPGRHLQIFSSSAELYIPDEPITTNNIAIKTTSRHGSNGKTQPIDIQGGTIFSDRNGRALREYLFVDGEQSYSAEPISILSGHLMADPRSMVLRRALDIDEPTLLLLANTGVDRNGTTVPAAFVVIDRAQQVTGFMRATTLGTPLAFATAQAGEAFVVTRRDLAGPEWNYLEQFDERCMSDAGVIIEGSGSTVDLTGIAEHLEGQEVYVHVDGLPIGTFTPSGNMIDLGDESYSARVEVGLRMVPRIILHPYKGQGSSSPTMQRQRIFRLLLQLERTGGAAVGINGRAVRAISFQNFESGLLDPTIDELLFSGAKRVSGLSGWELEPKIEITQIEPMPFLMRSITYDVRY